MATTGDQMIPALIAPDLGCAWCVEAMREPTLTGQSLVAPGSGGQYAPRAIAGRLHELRRHVHCGMAIGDVDHSARADIALPTAAIPTVVMYDSEPTRPACVSLVEAGKRADLRMHWANDLAESMKFARVGWRVVRIREAGQDPTGPLDLVLPRPIIEGRDNEAVLRLAVQHVLGIVEANVVAA
jgi:hypothetical protein